MQPEILAQGCADVLVARKAKLAQKWHDLLGEDVGAADRWNGAALAAQREVTAHARDILALSRGDGQVAHQEPKLLRDLLIVSRRWMSGLPIGSLVPRRIGLLVKEALALAAKIITPDRAGLTAGVEISRFRAGKLVVSQQFENLVEARDLWFNAGNAFLGDNATADTPHCRNCGPH